MKPSTVQFQSIQLASPHIKGDPSYSLFTTNQDFHTNVIANVKPHSTILISTYNVGITDFGNTLETFLSALCRCVSVHLLVGINDHHDKNREILGTLSRWQKEKKNLTVSLLPKNHVKAIIVTTGKTVAGWAGSLNFGNITLHEVMIRLTEGQTRALLAHILHLKTFSKPFRPVQLLNKTRKKSQ